MAVVRLRACQSEMMRSGLAGFSLSGAGAVQCGKCFDPISVANASSLDLKIVDDTSSLSEALMLSAPGEGGGGPITTNRR